MTFDDVDAARPAHRWRAPAGAVRALEGVHWGAAGLVALISVATLVAAVRAQGIGSPWIFPDELIYWDLARSLASTGDLAIRGVATTGHPPLYPLSLAPAFAFGDTADAYAVAKWINALAFSMTALPTYLLARRLLATRWAILAAALALLVPAAAYAGVLMSENLFYPVFVLALLTIVRAIERPTARRQAAALAVIVVAYLTRAEAVVLVPILLSATALVALSEGRRGFWQRLKPFRTTAGSIVGAFGLLAAAQWLRGSSPGDLLGVYAGTVQSYSLPSVARWSLYHAVDLELYVGVLPLLFAIVVSARLLRRDDEGRPARIVAAVAVATTGWLLLLVGAVSSTIDPGLHDRYIFYAAPLLFVLFVHGIRIRSSLPRRQLAVVGLFCVGLPLALPYGDVLGNASFEALALLPWNNTLLAKSHVPLAMAIFVASLCLLGLVRRSSIVLLQVLFVAASMWLLTLIGQGQMATSADWVGSDHAADPAWIDHLVGDAPVAVLWRRDPSWTPRLTVKRADAIWRSEFFNDRVVAFYALGKRMPYDLPTTQAGLVGQHVIDAEQRRALADYGYILTASPLRIDGVVVARDRRAGLTLFRVDGPIRLASNGGGT
jgi:hypothetical protein